jgi:hypothetical protein
VEAVRAPAAELELPHPARAAEHGGDPAARPAERVLDRRERPRHVRRRGQLGKQRTHEVGATIMEARDLGGVAHGVAGRMLA